MRIALIIMMLVCGVANGEIITDTNVSLSSDSFNLHSLTVYQTPDKSDYTVACFQFSDSILSFIYCYMDEGSDWYLLSKDSVFNANTIDSYSNVCLFKTTSTGSFSYDMLINTGSFYLGFNTGNNNGSGSPPRNIYGWVELNNTGNNITMTSNSVSYESGIIIGSIQPVPEPSSIVLMIISMAILIVKYCGVRT